MRNILIYSIALLAIFSCVKDGRGYDESADRITIAPYIPQTKADGFIENNIDLNASGHTMVVYDYMQANLNSPVGTTGWYMDGVTMECDPNGGWHYSGDYEDSEFLWLDQTRHSFFGWLVMSSSPVTPSFSKESMVLSIPEIEFTASTSVWDFMYSGVQTRYYEKAPADGGRPDISPVDLDVDLEMKHLFSAFRFYVKNQRETPVQINSVTLNNIHTKKRAEISYGVQSESLNYLPTDANGRQYDDVDITGNTGSVATGAQINAFGSDDGYFMVWPQTADEFADASIVIKFTQGGGAEQTKEFKLNELGQTEWLAGNRYSYNITFSDKQIDLKCYVQNWDVSTENIDFSDQVTVSSTLKWVAGTVESCDETTGEVVLYTSDEMVAVAEFQINSPEGATWTASLIPVEGHQDAFTLIDSSKYGSVGTEAKVKIKVNNQAPIAPKHVCILRITVQTADGRTIVVKNLVPEGKDYEEYRIIQNLING